MRATASLCFNKDEVKSEQNNGPKGYDEEKKTRCVAGHKVTGIEEKKKSKGGEVEEGVG